MRLSLLLLSIVPVIASAGPLTDDQLLEKVRQRATVLEEVTREPVLMQSKTALLCRPPTPAETAADKANPHLNKFARLFVDKAGRPAAEGHEPVHPEGTVLLKEKLPADPKTGGPAAAATAAELFTGMLKREKGFNPDCGDWEFFTVTGDAKNLTARGKLQSCMDCHQDYPKSDFVTRALVPARRQTPAADGSILLHSKDAWIFAKQMRYEPQPHKNTLGYWTQKEDTAEWHFKTAAAGRYEIEVLQGCGTGSGGAEVKVSVATGNQEPPHGEVKFTVEDTGHFQNFKPRVIGTVEIPESDWLSLKVIPLTKPGVAVMDLRQIVLRPAPKPAK